MSQLMKLETLFTCFTMMIGKIGILLTYMKRCEKLQQSREPKIVKLKPNNDLQAIKRHRGKPRVVADYRESGDGKWSTIEKYLSTC
jgi:hypothetical protein